MYEATSFEPAIENGLGEILIVGHTSPGFQDLSVVPSAKQIRLIFLARTLKPSRWPARHEHADNPRRATFIQIGVAITLGCAASFLVPGLLDGLLVGRFGQDGRYE